jgi:pimeloyl-ACP methyl ester carboxylesterase
LGLALAYAAVCVVLADGLTRPERRAPDRLPSDYGLAYEAVAFPSRVDAVPLAGWLIAPLPANGDTGEAGAESAAAPSPAGAARRPVVLVHGRGGDRQHELEGRFLEVAAALAGDGHRVLVFDLRGFGGSGGTRYSLGGREVRDAAGAVDFLARRGLAPDGVDVVGYSMGAATSLLFAAEEARVRAVATDSAYAELGEVLEAQVPRLSGLPRWFTPGTVAVARALTGVDPARIRPVDAVPPLAARGAPLLVIHGERDSWVPPSHGRRLAATYGPGAETLFVPGAEHVGSYAADPAAYLARLLPFLARADTAPHDGRSV